jgi:hypothetical protein
MADREGGLVASATAVCSDKTDQRRAGYLLDDSFSPFWGLVDHRRPGADVSFPSASVTTTYYRLRARDDGQPSPPLYYSWISTDPNSTPTPAPIGAWVEITIIEKWTV